MTQQALDQQTDMPTEHDALEITLKRQVEAERQSHQQRLSRYLIIGRIGLVLTILLSWELASGTLLNQRYVSKPSEVVRLLHRWISSGEVYSHVWTTLIEVSAGYVLGVALGLTMAILLSFSQRAHSILRPFIVGFYGIPKIALAPILVMWLGLGITPKIVIAAIIVFFVMFMNSYAGLSNVRTELVDIARVMGATRLQILYKIMLPSAAPFILTAMRITIPDAVVGAILGEFIAGSSGIGNLIRRSSNQLVTAGVFGGILILATMVIVMRALLTPLERRILGWRDD